MVVFNIEKGKTNVDKKIYSITKTGIEKLHESSKLSVDKSTKINSFNTIALLTGNEVHLSKSVSDLSCEIDYLENEISKIENYEDIILTEHRLEHLHAELNFAKKSLARVKEGDDKQK